jgi:hypothetical protein
LGIPDDLANRTEYSGWCSGGLNGSPATYSTGRSFLMHFIFYLYS